ncbi:MAG TPA: hypothetical protein VF642_05015 [Propionibacteriaceae bacterium]|jgi:hypothetical protein
MFPLDILVTTSTQMNGADARLSALGGRIVLTQWWYDERADFDIIVCKSAATTRHLYAR